MFFYIKEDFVQFVLNLIAKTNAKLNKKVTQIQIQKIIYVLYTYFLVFEKPIAKIDFETWRWGPVIYDLWRKQTKFKGYNVKIDIDLEIDKKYASYLSNEICLKIVEFMLKIEVWDVVQICHEQTPWKSLYIPSKNIKIKDPDIIAFHNSNPDNFFYYLNFVIKSKI